MGNKKIGFCAAAAAALLAGATAWAAGVDHDFDGDGKADLAVYHAKLGNWYVQQSGSGNSLWQPNWGWEESRPVCGDFDGDGKADVGVYHIQASNWYIRLSSNGNLLGLNFGQHDARPVPGDYDGDGQTDFAVYQRATGLWTIRRSSDASVYQVGFGNSELRPVPADFDGDGKTDLAVFHRTTAMWYIQQSTAGFTQKQFGWSAVRPVVGDYDGDGKADIAVYHAAGGNWYILNSSNQTIRTQNWGWSAAQPVPGDYDGDGKTDIAVYHRANGDWYIQQSGSGNSLRLQNFGWFDACPIPSYQNGGIRNLIILAFGDSITYGTSSSSNGPKTGYPIRLERILEPAWGGHCYIVNAGDPGESTDSGKKRIAGFLASVKPDVTLIMEGTNDEFYSVPYNTTESNLRSMVNQAKNAGSQVVLSTIPPVIKSAFRDRTAQQKRIQGFNPRIFTIASSLNILTCDNFKAITSQPNWQSALMDQKTANHPNDAGYVVMRDAWFKSIQDGWLDGKLY